jgi:hypothetical protein
VQLLGRVGHVLVGEVGGPVHGDVRGGEALRSSCPRKRLTVFLEQAGVGVEPHGVDMAGLVRAQDIAGAPELQVLHGDGVAAAQLGVVLEDPEPLLRLQVIPSGATR